MEKHVLSRDLRYFDLVFLLAVHQLKHLLLRFSSNFLQLITLLLNRLVVLQEHFDIVFVFDHQCLSSDGLLWHLFRVETLRVLEHSLNELLDWIPKHFAKVLLKFCVSKAVHSEKLPILN